MRITDHGSQIYYDNFYRSWGSNNNSTLPSVLFVFFNLTRFLRNRLFSHDIHCFKDLPDEKGPNILELGWTILAGRRRVKEQGNVITKSRDSTSDEQTKQVSWFCSKLPSEKERERSCLKHQRTHHSLCPEKIETHLTSCCSSTASLCL